MPSDSALPYLSVVVTPSSDSANKRFAEIWAAQIQRHNKLSSELVFASSANSGIRQARGEFILVTSSDALFSEELLHFFAEHRLQRGRMYRIDRHDVNTIPPSASPEEQLAHCRANVSRLHTLEGVFPLTREGFREIGPSDITRPDSRIHFGSGWFPMERTSSGEAFRWISNNAEILIKPPEAGAVLVLEIEPGSGVASSPPLLQLLDQENSKVAEWKTGERICTEFLVLPAKNNSVQTLRLRTPDGGLPVIHDPRILNFRVYRCDWAEAPISRPGISDTGVVTRKLLGAWRQSGNPTWLFRGPVVYSRAQHLLKSLGEDVFEAGMDYRLGSGWHRLEYAGEEKLRWVSRKSQLRVRRDSMPQNLAILIEPGPGVNFEPFTLIAADSAGEQISIASVRGLTYIEIPIPAPPGHIATIHFTIEGGGPRTGQDPRDLAFRVLACGRRNVSKSAFDYVTPERWTALTIASRPALKDWPAQNPRQIAEMGCPQFLHTHGCSDFLLMAREHWLDIRGFAELDLKPSALETLLCYAAHHSGVKEEILRDPMRLYHLGMRTEAHHQNMPAWSNTDLAELITQMRVLQAPVIFNIEELDLATG